MFFCPRFQFLFKLLLRTKNLHFWIKHSFANEDTRKMLRREDAGRIRWKQTTIIAFTRKQPTKQFLQNVCPESYCFLKLVKQEKG